MITRQRKRLVATLAIVLAVAAIVAVTASLCTGGNDRDDRDSVPPTPQQILARRRTTMHAHSMTMLPQCALVVLISMTTLWPTWSCFARLPSTDWEI